MECQLQLAQTTARHVHCFLDEAIEFECNGCSVEHPSQLQHECLMLSGEAHIRFCLDQALLLVDWERVKTDFDQSWSHTRFHDKVWYQTLWPNDGWYEQLVSALLALDCLSDAWPDSCGHVYIYIYIYIYTSTTFFHIHSPQCSHHGRTLHGLPFSQPEIHWLTKV